MSQLDPTLGPEQQALLITYVRQALEMLDAGETPQPGEICKHHPELITPLSEALGLGQELSSLQAAARDSDPLAGMLLAKRYLLEKRIGMGAMGVVYRAEDQELKRSVAVKILDARLFHDPIAKQRFFRESEMLASVEHPQIVAVHDRGQSDPGLLFLVMEHLQGISLADVLALLEDSRDAMQTLRAQFPDAEAPEDSYLRLALRWTADLAAGLAAAHALGVFHRDVKPSNIFIRQDYRAVLLDFGIAVRAEDAKLTATATTLGTPWYMAPEQALGKVRLEPSLDVYGLCATLYHLLTLHPPYEGEALEVLLKLQREDPRPAVQWRPDLPRDLQAILDQGLERDPLRRYPNMRALEADLRAFLEHRPVSARPLGRFGRQWRSIRRAPARALAVTASLIAVVVASIAVPLWINSTAAERMAQKAQLLRRLPSLLALEGGPEQRLIAELSSERASNLSILDEILALDPADLPIRLWRAALRLDHGQFAAAAADLAMLAAQGDSPYMSAVADRYLAVNSDSRGTLAVDLQDLPEPASVEDHFVAGFHELRNRHELGYAERAEQHLQAAATYLPAQDLRLIALLARADLESDKERKRALFAEAHDESLQLEGSYGYATARTLATRGVALIAMGRYGDAIEPLQRSLQLRPQRHGPLNNLGIAHRRLGNLVEAGRYLDQAANIRPHFWNTLYSLAQLHRDLGDFARAYEYAERVPTEGLGGVAWKRADLIGFIALREALALRAAGRDSAAALRRSLEAYRLAIAAADTEARRDWLRLRQGIARALQENKKLAASIDLLKLLWRDPLNPYRLGNLIGVLPEANLSSDQVAHLLVYLRILAASLEGGDEAFRARQKAEARKILVDK